MSRPFSAVEREVVSRLIDLAPADERESLRKALVQAEVGDNCSCGCGSFFIEYVGEPRGKHGLIAEGFVDLPEEPSPIGVMLFGEGGRPTYLEIYVPERLDGDPSPPFPSASEIHD